MTTSVQNGNLIISYNGTKIGQYRVTAKSVQVSEVADVVYSGIAYTPKPVVSIDGVTLTEGIDYTLTYANNINAGSASIIISGKGKYLGNKTVNFRIQPRSLTGGKITTALTNTYTGSGIKPAISVTNANGTKVAASDYTITYKNNLNVGTATLTITGKKNYCDTLTATFKIVKRKISDCTVAKVSNQAYTGKTLKPLLSIKIGSKTLVNNKDYKLKYYSNKKPGQAKIVITGIGSNLTGTRTVYFNIVPKQVSKISVSSYRRKVVVKWGKSSYADGYTVFYSKSKKGTYKSWKTTAKKSMTKSGLTKGKVYYVMVRPYKTIKGKKEYGKYNEIVRIVVK